RFLHIQMKDCKYFTPNREMHKEFADALINARQKGVNIAAVNCDVYEDEMTVSDFVKIIL
ncbi:MAG: DNA/RNA nuclease SfsA, partial [Ruminococcaceae bacterium]|nr:DNA/RNA nuclease SfsA [Oscillospiraceae bacterium]